MIPIAELKTGKLYRINFPTALYSWSVADTQWFLANDIAFISETIYMINSKDIFMFLSFGPNNESLQVLHKNKIGWIDVFGVKVNLELINV